MAVFAAVALSGALSREIGHMRSSLDIPRQDWSVALISSMRRIGRTEPGMTRNRIALRGARGEYVSFQVVVTAATSSLTNVTIQGSDCVNGMASISTAGMQFYREHYIHVTSPSPDPGWGNRPLGAGWYPDALLPLPATNAMTHGSAQSSFTVQSGTNQPVWADIDIPRDAPSGAYECGIHIAADQGDRDVTVSLRVWNFELPLKPTLKSSFGMHKPALTDRGMHELLLEHRVMPESVNPEDARGLIDQFGLNTTGLRFWSQFSKRDCTMDAPPEFAALRSTLELYPSTLDVHLYSADEIDGCPQVFGTIRRWGLAMHTVSPRIRNLVTVAPQEALFSDGGASGKPAVDIWPLLPKVWDQDAKGIARARALGSEIWAYTALVQDGYSPKWEIDFAPANYRIFPGFLAQSMDLRGVLYWRVELWTQSPFEDLRGYSVNGHFYPGEGMLVYPPTGGSGHPIPSMRLKWIREGVQDYEYVAILKKLGCGVWAEKQTRRVAADWHEWSDDPAILESVRDRLGDKIESLLNGEPNRALQASAFCAQT